MALDTIDVTLSRILFHKPGKFDPAGLPYLIARTSSGTTVKGTMRKPIEGERYRFYGSWAPQKGYDELAFEFISHEVLMDEGVAGVTQYLKNYVTGLGIVKATAIVEGLGTDALHVLRTDPEKALAVPGITLTLIENIRKHFIEEVTIDPAAYARLVDLFAGHRFPRKVVKSLLLDWGSDADQKIKSNPYILLAYPRMGWKGVDAFALDAHGAACDPLGIDRQVAAIVEGLERLAGDGHTYGTRIDIERIAFDLIGSRPEDLAWHMATIDGLVVRLDDRDNWWDSELEGGTEEAYALAKYASAERAIARHLARLTAGAGPLSISLACDGLSDEQQAVVGVIERHPVSILAGPPGTGKSYTLAAVIAELVRHQVGTIRVVAPTGKAAKRSAELLALAIPGNHIECSTIHKALGVGKSEDPEGASASEAKINRGRDEFGFRHGEGSPLEVNFLVADECSMIDTKLMASLLSALATGTRLVMVGDADQLPSVGPGSVLRDLIVAGIPTAMLTTIRRSDGGGRVVRACHAIKDGLIPTPAERIGLPTENWVHVEENDPVRIAATIIELHASAKRNGRYDPLWDMQVVSAQKASPAGVCCNDLNRSLGALLNPLSAGDDEGPPQAFRVGDKIVRTKNGACDEMLLRRAINADDLDTHEDWRWKGESYSFRETAVVNGDMGQVLDIVPDPDASEVFAVVRFRTPDRLCRLPMSEHHLLPAYALTVHKCQGSGFPYVIVPVHNGYYWDSRTNTGLWCRELVYTAISRAETLLVTVGQSSAIRAAIGRKTIHQRRTRLAERIACGGPTEVVR